MTVSPSQLDHVVAANRASAEHHVKDLATAPRRALTVVTCMDSRIDAFRAFGLGLGDAHVIRNAGGRVTDDTLRSLAASCWLLGVREVGVIHHTACGILGSEADVRARLEAAAGVEIPLPLHAIDDPDGALSADVDRVVGCPFLPHDLRAWGARFDVETGLLDVVVSPRSGDGT